jgi:uncharacterized protein (DUF2141 family)/type II secretory pathway pseudopilin PulG
MKNRGDGFTLIEMAFGILMLGLVMIAFANIFTLFQKSATTAREYGRTQQNSRIALDYLTEYLRQAGAATDNINGQKLIVHASPYQVAFNADIDNGQAISGEAPLSAISINHSPATVPAAGTTIYTPDADYNSPAETMVLTLDSELDGTVDAGDRGDDPEENGNPKLYVLKKVVYGYGGGGSNEVRTANLALVRGPDTYNDGRHPTPLFQYWYDHDEDDSTPDQLWGDADANGVLSQAEIAALTPVSANLLGVIRKIHVTVTSESRRYDHSVANTSDGYRSVEMRSEVYIRNDARLKATVYGYVFHDVDGNGNRGPNEAGIPNVSVDVSGNQVITNSYGVYSAVVGAGSYTVTETDPTNYTSTTSNSVPVNITQGEVKRVDFGDQATTATGVIKGTVYNDLNSNGAMDAGEPGVQGVTISFDHGVVVASDNYGYYELVVTLGNYVVTETDLQGWGSTTSNIVSASIMAGGDIVVRNFGDVEAPIYGHIEGFVFEDTNKNGNRDMGDQGIPNVTLTMSSGDSTKTDATGYYLFDLVPSTYSITERDLSGYTSSTPNTFANLVVVPDTLITLDFGDFLQSSTGFDEVALGQSAATISIGLAELKEDGIARNDLDIIAGTRRTGSGNIRVYHNRYKVAATPITQLFKATPDYQRDAPADIGCISLHDFNNDGAAAVITGLDLARSPNINVWYNDGAGTISSTPNQQHTSLASTKVVSSQVTDLNMDGKKDLIVGLKSASGTFTGGFEVYITAGPLTRTQHEKSVNYGLTTRGEIHAVATGDLDGDGDPDLVIGSHDSDYTGWIDVYENENYGSGTLTWFARYKAPGAVNGLVIGDLLEDSNRDMDIVAAVATGSLQGGVAIWTYDNGVFGKYPTAFMTGASGEVMTNPTAVYDTQGEPLCVDMAMANGDVFPDIVVGTRSTSLYAGDLHFIATRGQASASTLVLNSGFAGEFSSVVFGDVNNDNYVDIVAGTRTSPSQGRIMLYVNNTGTP